MPIEAKTAEECFKKYEGFLKELICPILTTQHIFKIFINDTSGDLRFPRGDEAISIPVETRLLGTLYLFLRQFLKAKKDESKGKFVLYTTRYFYRLSEIDDEDREPLVRWEYERRDSEVNVLSCRHHIHIHAPISKHTSTNRDWPMRKFYFPCGWVTIEEVLRFLITDLGFTPLCDQRKGPNEPKEWPVILAESEKKFYWDFTPEQKVKGKDRH